MRCFQFNLKVQLIILEILGVYISLIRVVRVVFYVDCHFK